MKAVVVREFGPPEVMAVEEIEAPKPRGSEVVIQIHAAGINPVETYLRAGNYARLPELPYTPGNDGAGVVDAVGETVGRFKPGDRVFTARSVTGTYAEYSLCDESDLGVLPENVPFEQGAGVWTPYATAYRAIFEKAKAATGETVLVHGASGAVGLAAIQWAKHAGLKVIGTASSDDGRALIRHNGADAVFDHTDENHFTDILDYTGGTGVNVIVEMLANVNLEKDFKCLAMFGRIVIVGSRGTLEFSPRLTMGKDASILGLSLFNAPRAVIDEIHAQIFDGLKAGHLQPFIRESMSLSDAPRAHREVIESKALGKIVLTP